MTRHVMHVRSHQERTALSRAIVLALLSQPKPKK